MGAPVVVGAPSARLRLAVMSCCTRAWLDARTAVCTWVAVDANVPGRERPTRVCGVGTGGASEKGTQSASRAMNSFCQRWKLAPVSLVIIWWLDMNRFWLDTLL